MSDRFDFLWSGRHFSQQNRRLLVIRALIQYEIDLAARHLQFSSFLVNLSQHEADFQVICRQLAACEQK